MESMAKAGAAIAAAGMDAAAPLAMALVTVDQAEEKRKKQR